jgi:DNA damage-inducible protein 1
MAAAISSGTRQFKETFLRHQRRQRDAAMEKQRQIEVSGRSEMGAGSLYVAVRCADGHQLLNADPYDIEVRLYRQLSMRGDADSAKAQKKIEEAIRMEAVLENMQHAMEYSVSLESRGLMPWSSGSQCGSQKRLVMSPCCISTSR